MAKGKRNIIAGGDITQSVVITGDQNVVQVAEDSSTLRALLTHAEFSGRAEQAALTSHQGALVGREAVLEAVSTQLRSQTRVIVLHGPGGIGKTRFLLALSDIAPDGTQLWYARTEAESVERDLAALDRNSQHVIVADDAHRFVPLPYLREVLVNPDFAGKVTLVLATRSVFKDSVTYQLGSLPGNQVSAIEVRPLTNVDIDRLLQNPPHTIPDEKERYAILGIAEGNPLIARIAARLVQRDIPLAGLTRDQVLTRYLDEVIHDLAEAGYDDHYIGYLEVLAALGMLDLTNQPLRETVQRVVGISHSEEECIVSRLTEAELVERYWKTIKIASEVLADHILIHHFFDPKTRRADYQKQIIEPFFPQKPKEILTNLAEAEIKGESSEAGALLGQKLSELYRIVSSGNNLARWNVLDSLQNVAYLRPDDLLAIMALIVDGPEQPSTISPDHWRLEVKHEMVLDKAVDILSHTIYRGGLRDAVSYLYRLARYRLESGEYSRVREKACKALIAIAKFEPQKPYAVQLTLLEMIPIWLKQDFTGNLDLALALLKPMLSIELSSAETDPTEHGKVVFRQAALNPVGPLRQIRDQVLNILYEAYKRTSSLIERLRIVQVLDGAVPHGISNVRLSAETQAWLQPDCEKTARFFSEQVVLEAELPILDVVAKGLWRARRFGSYQIEELRRLRQQLQDHKLYQLYRVLVGWNRWDEEEGEQIDGKAVEQRRQQAMEHYLDTLSPATLEQLAQNLERIAEQTRNAGEYGMHRFDLLLQKIGEKHPDLARQLVEKILAECPALKHHLSFVIGGLQSSAPHVAWTYVKSWVASDDAILWLVAAHSYNFLEWSMLQEHEWDLLRCLLTKDSLPVDFELLRLTRQFAPHNPDFAVGLLKALAVRGDENILRHVADVLAWPGNAQDGYAVRFANPQDYIDIVQNFERLPSLDYHAEQCLERLGQIDPMQVIDFIERRISNTEHQPEENRYDAIPLHFFRSLESIRSSSAYPDVLRRVRDWILREDSWFQWETPRVLKEISGGLGEVINDTLMEWIDSGDIQKLKGAAKLLCSFNYGPAFYHLCREIIRRTDDESVLRHISAAINSSPELVSWGPLSSFWKQRRDEIAPWLQDEDFRVRRFAKRMVDRLQAYLEREQAEEEFEKRSW